MRKLFTIAILSMVMFSCSDDSMDIPVDNFTKKYSGDIYEWTINKRTYYFEVGKSFTINVPWGTSPTIYECNSANFEVISEDEKNIQILITWTWVRPDGHEIDYADTFFLRNTNGDPGLEEKGLVRSTIDPNEYRYRTTQSTCK